MDQYRLKGVFDEQRGIYLAMDLRTSCYTLLKMVSWLAIAVSPRGNNDSGKKRNRATLNLLL
jgi:hypothetical protein